jgi:hypothetical protein
MANSDWPRIADQEQAEQKWVYFTPVLGHLIQDGWQASYSGSVWFDPWSHIVPHIHERDLFLFWRAPLKAM